MLIFLVLEILARQDDGKGENSMESYENIDIFYVPSLDLKRLKKVIRGYDSFFICIIVDF